MNPAAADRADPPVEIFVLATTDRQVAPYALALESIAPVHVTLDQEALALAMQGVALQVIVVELSRLATLGPVLSMRLSRLRVGQRLVVVGSLDAAAMHAVHELSPRFRFELVLSDVRALRAAVSSAVASVRQDAHATAMLARIDRAMKLRGTVPPIALQLLEWALARLPGRLSLAEFARDRGLRPRTIQRRLAAHRLSARRLFGWARLLVAGWHVGRGESPMGAADLAGYSDPSAFYHALRRHAGRAPAELRSARAFDALVLALVDIAAKPRGGTDQERRARSLDAEARPLS